jgi:hypothetical protein
MPGTKRAKGKWNKKNREGLVKNSHGARWMEPLEIRQQGKAVRRAMRKARPAVGTKQAATAKTDKARAALERISFARLPWYKRIWLRFLRIIGLR